MTGPGEVLSFWFPTGYDADAETFRRQVLWWFGGGAEVDRQIVARFSEALELARTGQLDWPIDTGRERLARIIVLDQFSRSVYRGTPQAYAQDPLALELTLTGYDLGLDRGLSVSERIFFSLPMGHSEDPALLEKAVLQATALVDDAPPHLRELFRFSQGQAEGHRDVIARFGRHPQRNAVLGRTSTPEELEYLAGIPVHMRRP
jgi:uncharacterized protein (DUF924 family)